MKEIKLLPCWDKLTDAERETLGRSTTQRTYSKGMLLKESSEACVGMIYVLSGSVRVYIISEEGREITLFRIGKGNSCILSAGCAISRMCLQIEMLAESDTRILVVDAGTYAALMDENIEVRCYTYELASEKLSSVIWVLQEIIFARFDQRLARFLLSECEKSGTNVITMSKEAIAQEVNTAREVVSRMLKQFSMDGLITMNQKTLTVIDADGLRQLI